MPEVSPYTKPVPSYTDTKEGLIEALRASAGSSTRQFDIAKAILDVKGQEEIASQTKSLMLATWVLAGATIALVFTTIGLVIVSLHH